MTKESNTNIEDKMLKCCNIKDEIKELKGELNSMGVSAVKEHIRHGGRYGDKIISVSSYLRSNDGRTEPPTEEHVQFVLDIKYIIDYCMSIRDVIKLDADDYVLNDIDSEVVVGAGRTDLLITTHKGRKICIECQICTLQSDKLYKRTYNYISQDHEVIWVRKLGVKYQRIYYWMIDDCNHDRSYGKREWSKDFSKLCKNTKIKSEISKDYGYVFIKFLTRPKDELKNINIVNKKSSRKSSMKYKKKIKSPEDIVKEIDKLKRQFEIDQLELDQLKKQLSV